MRVLHFTYNLSPLANVTNLFGNWLNVIENKTKAQIHLGVCALVSTI
jgi:hypothetical protein